jgi:hypothetical protein
LTPDFHNTGLSAALLTRKKKGRQATKNQNNQIEPMPREPYSHGETSNKEQATIQGLRGKNAKETQSNQDESSSGDDIAIIMIWVSGFFRWWNGSRIVALLTLVITSTTIIYAYFSYQQWQTMQKQLLDNEAAQAAHLVVDPDITVTVEAYPKSSHVKFVIRNVGASVANDIGIIGMGECSDDVTIAAGPSPLTPIISQPNATGGSVGAGSTEPEDMNVIYTEDCASALKKGTTYAWQQIVVSYTDIFDRKQVISHSVCYNRQFRDFRTCPRGQSRGEANTDFLRNRKQ